jgi:hypothetical protein
MRKRPLLSVMSTPSMPTYDASELTSGSFRVASASACCRSTHGRVRHRVVRDADALDHADVLHRKQPFGITTYSANIGMIVPSTTMSVSVRCSNAQRRPRSQA